jgi:hypothetical protein
MASETSSETDRPRDAAGDQPEDGPDPHDLRATALDGAAAGGRLWRWGLRLGGGVALLALIAVAAIALSPLIPRPAAPQPPPLALTALQLPAVARSCISGAAWSPDSARVAIVRDSVCDANAAHDLNDPSALVFDAASGKLLSAAPLALFLLTSGAPPKGQVALDGVVWSARGDQLAVLFTIFAPDPARGLAPASYGVALLTLRGATLILTAFWAGNVASENFLDPLELPYGPQGVVEWNLRPGADGPRTLTVTPAYGYRWNPDGSLTPLAQPVNQPGAASGSTSASLASFSMWSAGQLWAVNALLCSNGLNTFLPQPYLALTLSRLAWSPDGAYLVALSVAGRYPLPGAAPTSASTVTPAFCSGGPATESAPLAPMPDAGLRAAEPLAASPVNAAVSLAWRADGERLAAFTFNITGSGGAILIYDCRTGARLKRITASQIPITGDPGTGPAKNVATIFTGGTWSPDGRRLLVEATGAGAAAFILGQRALGA